jgi:hypothetical protein
VKPMDGGSHCQTTAINDAISGGYQRMRGALRADCWRE